MKEVHMGQPQKGYVPLTGGSMAVYNSSGLAYYRHSDWIGSSRLASTPTRSIYFDGAYAPFGEGYAETGTADLSFTGMNQDTVSNLYDFPDREYSIQGRWPSPDPAGITSVDPRNPQSWNRYGYVLNNPLGFMDPTGRRLRCGKQSKSESKPEPEPKPESKSEPAAVDANVDGQG
jgi:RHS repeat-associated protein